MGNQLLAATLAVFVVVPGCKKQASSWSPTTGRADSRATSASTSGPATDAEIGQLEGLAKALERNPNPELVLAGAAEAKLGHGDACLEALSACAKSDPSAKGPLGAKAVEACGFPCPGDLKPFAALSPDQRMPELLKVCGESDKVFTGEAAKDRASFDFFTYILVRGVMERAIGALERNGSPRASTVKASLLALLPRLAPQMVDPSRRKP
jgi:hypothetical protein